MANPNDTIITSDVHYSDIADKIREKRGISDTWKPNRLIVGLKRVYKKNPTFKIKSLQHFFDGNLNTPLIDHPNLDTSNCELFDSAFFNNTIVTEIHNMDVSSGTNFNAMFSGAANCTTIPLDWFENHLSAISIGSMFMSCGIKQVGNIVCPNATNASTLFNKNKAITTVGNIRLDKAPTTANMFYNSSALISVGDIYVPVSTNVSSFFYGCKKLTTIGTITMNKATNVATMFYNCLVLANVSFAENTIKVSGLDLSATKYLTRDSLLSLIKGLDTTTTSSRTITVSKYCINGSTLTADLISNDPELLSAYNDAVAAGWSGSLV